MTNTNPSIIYYRWTYSPTTGDVTLSHNHEGHPTDIRFHGQMAADRPETDLLYGYAHRLDNGWKVIDDESKPVDDPHIQAAVEKEVGTYEARQVSQGR